MSCNVYLHRLQTWLKDINDAGGNLVAISVENPDASMAVAKKNEVVFTVLSDPNLDTARKFNIVYQLPDTTDAMSGDRTCCINRLLQAFQSKDFDVVKL